MNEIMICRVGQRPEVVRTNNSTVELEGLIRGWSSLPYPDYLRKGKGTPLRLIIDGKALVTGVPHNRWGIHGDFAVVKCPAKNPGFLSAEVIPKILADLDKEYGLIDPRAKADVIYASQIGVYLKSADRFVSEGGKWCPNLHFTGLHCQPEIKFINWLLLRYAPHIVAMHVSSHFRVDYSVEIQFGNSAADLLELQECRSTYAEAFDDGVLLREVVARPPHSWSSGLEHSLNALL